MTVTCPNCQTVYRIDPSKVPPGGVRARCAVCQGVFAVPAEASAAAVSAPRPSAAATASPAPAPAAAAPRTASGAGAGYTGGPPTAPSPTPAAAPTSPAPTQVPPPLVAPSAPPAAFPRPAVSRPAAPPTTGRPAGMPAPASAGAAATGTATLSPAAAASAAAPAPSAPRPGVVNPFLSQDPRQKARRLARALVSDIAVYNAERRREALRGGRLKEAFAEEIKKSWEEYTVQVGKELAESTPFFTEALNEILAEGQAVF